MEITVWFTDMKGFILLLCQSHFFDVRLLDHRTSVLVRAHTDTCNHHSQHNHMSNTIQSASNMTAQTCVLLLLPSSCPGNCPELYPLSHNTIPVMSLTVHLSLTPLAYLFFSPWMCFVSRQNSVFHIYFHFSFLTVPPSIFKSCVLYSFVYITVVWGRLLFSAWVD